MHKLFIIGNGFDCYAHFDKNGDGMKTRYKDFKDYILARHPDIIYSNGFDKLFPKKIPNIKIDITNFKILNNSGGTRTRAAVIVQYTELSIA